MSERADSQGNVIGAEILVVDRDPAIREGMLALFGAGELHVTAVADPSEAWALLEQRFFSVVVLDLDTPEPGGGVETARAVALASPISAIVMLTPRRSFDDAMAAVRAGAVDVVVKSPPSVPYLRERLAEAAQRSLARRRLRATLGEARDFHEELLRRFMEVERRLYEGAGGRRPTAGDESLTLLLVSPDAALGAAIGEAGGPFRLLHATSGGGAIDRATGEEIDLALIADELPDLPPATVARSLRAAHPGILIAELDAPARGAKVEIVDGDRRIPVINNFHSPAVLAGRLGELYEATRARQRERSFLMGFRERNYELIQRVARLKQRLAAE